MTHYYRWLSEKYDGLRVCWNHLDQNLYLKNEKVILRKWQMRKKRSNYKHWLNKYIPDQEGKLSCQCCQISIFLLSFWMLKYGILKYTNKITNWLIIIWGLEEERLQTCMESLLKNWFLLSLKKKKKKKKGKKKKKKLNVIRERETSNFRRITRIRFGIIFELSLSIRHFRIWKFLSKSEFRNSSIPRATMTFLYLYLVNNNFIYYVLLIINCFSFIIFIIIWLLNVISPVYAPNGKQHVQQIIKNILEDGGEGIIARKPESLYIPGRSNELLKFKVIIFNNVILLIINWCLLFILRLIEIKKLW